MIQNETIVCGTRKILKVFGPCLYQTDRKIVGEIFCCCHSSSSHKKHMNRKSMSKPGKFHHHHHHPVIFSHQWSCFTAVMSERLVVLRPQRDQNWLTFLTIFLKLANWGCLKMRKQFQQVQQVCYCFSISLGKFWA